MNTKGKTTTSADLGAVSLSLKNHMHICQDKKALRCDITAKFGSMLQ